MFVVNDQDVNPSQLTAAQMQFLEEELADYKKNPNEGSTWEEIKSRIFKEK